MDKPIWLMDVDGVLNAVNYQPSPDQRREVLNGFAITWTPAITDAIAALHNEGLVEVRWLTTWADLANDHIGPALGWPDLKVVASPYDASRTAWWKLAYVMDLAVDDQLIVWADDDILGDPDARNWLKQEDAGNVFTICPDTRVGLTMEDVDRVAAWLNPFTR